MHNKTLTNEHNTLFGVRNPVHSNTLLRAYKTMSWV